MFDLFLPALSSLIICIYAQTYFRLISYSVWPFSSVFQFQFFFNKILFIRLFNKSCIVFDAYYLLLLARDCTITIACRFNFKLYSTNFSLLDFLWYTFLYFCLLYFNFLKLNMFYQFYVVNIAEKIIDFKVYVKVELLALIMFN